ADELAGCSSASASDNREESGAEASRHIRAVVERARVTVSGDGASVTTAPSHAERGTGVMSTWVKPRTHDDSNGTGTDHRLHVRALSGSAPPELDPHAVVAAHDRGARGLAGISGGRERRPQAGLAHGMRAGRARPVDPARLLGSLSRPGRTRFGHLRRRGPLSHRSLGSRAGCGTWDPGRVLCALRARRAP